MAELKKTRGRPKKTAVPPRPLEQRAEEVANAPEPVHDRVGDSELSETDWLKLKAEYIATGISYRKLADKYGLSYAIVNARVQKGKWNKLRKRMDGVTDKVIEERITQHVTDTVDLLAKCIDDLIVQISHGIGKGRYTTTASDVRDIVGALKNLCDLKGLKSQRDVAEQLARIAKLEKDASDSDIDKDIHVIIESIDGQQASAEAYAE